MIELKNVSFSYQGQDHGGLHDVSLNIKDGECVLLCGRSGCGKTTITRLINGLIPYFYPGELTGDVLADGKAISDELDLTACSDYNNLLALIGDWADYYNNDRYQWNLALLSPNEYARYLESGVYPLKKSAPADPFAKPLQNPE